MRPRVGRNQQHVSLFLSLSACHDNFFGPFARLSWAGIGGSERLNVVERLSTFLLGESFADKQQVSNKSCI